MITLTLDLELPPPWGDGSRVEIDLALHEGYGDDAAIAHAIVAAAASSDDGWVRLMDSEGDLWGVPRPWLHGWRTQRGIRRAGALSHRSRPSGPSDSVRA